MGRKDGNAFFIIFMISFLLFWRSMIMTRVKMCSLFYTLNIHSADSRSKIKFIRYNALVFSYNIYSFPAKQLQTIPSKLPRIQTINQKITNPITHQHHGKRHLQTKKLTILFRVKLSRFNWRWISQFYYHNNCSWNDANGKGSYHKW